MGKRIKNPFLYALSDSIKFSDLFQNEKIVKSRLFLFYQSPLWRFFISLTPNHKRKTGIQPTSHQNHSEVII